MRQRESVSRGERGLMAAILQDAVECYRKTCNSRLPREQSLHRETEKWIFSDDRSWVLSFVNVCDVLGMDAERIRHTLLVPKSSRRADDSAA
ncbi:MAG: hypothetical protein ACREQY_18100 [Candidatus Binatia bacterium]